MWDGDLFAVGRAGCVWRCAGVSRGLNAEEVDVRIEARALHTSSSRKKKKKTKMGTRGPPNDGTLSVT